jgi:hypothetical protein
MGASIVLRDHLYVFVMVPSVQLIFDAEVREVHGLLEVRQVVFVRPRFNLASVPIRSTIAVWPAAIRLLQPFLILALEFLFEHYPMDFRTGVTETLLFAKVGAIHLNVVGQLTGPADAGVEGLLSRIVAIPAVGLQEVVTSFRERDGALATVEPHKLR